MTVLIPFARYYALLCVVAVCCGLLFLYACRCAVWLFIKFCPYEMFHKGKGRLQLADDGKMYFRIRKLLTEFCATSAVAPCEKTNAHSTVHPT